MNLNLSLVKRVNLFTTAAIILLSSCTNNKQPASVTWLYGYGEIEKLNGHVKTVIDKRWGNDNSRIPYFIYTFNTKGDLVTIEDIFKSGKTGRDYKTNYDATGKKIESTGRYIDNGNKVFEMYKYNERQQINKYAGNTNQAVPDTNRFAYDKGGNLIEHVWYLDKNPLWVAKYKYTYNSAGICTQSYQFFYTWHDNFKTSTVDTTRYITFDDKNNWLKAVRDGDTLRRQVTYY